MDDYAFEHLRDLSDRAYKKGIYTFSAFLSEDEQSRLIEQKRSFAPFTLYGGAQGTQRSIARFGSPDKIGYEQDFPIRCLQIEPLNERFAEKLSHRDILGALMSLGIERAELGDIIARDLTAYLFCTEKIAPYLLENLHRIRSTDIKLSVCASVPQGALYRTEPVRLTVTSLRMDCVVSAALHLSRSRVQVLFAEKKIFLNGAVCEKPDAVLSPGDTFSVRGTGKFRFGESQGNSKKGKNVIILQKYV